jgi:hypothetical protein
MLLVSAVWCLVGLFIGWARPDDAVARLAFAASVGTAIVFIQVDFLAGLVPGALYQPLQLVVGYHFFYRFPGGVRRGRPWRWLLWLFYGWGIVSCALRQPLNWVYLTGGAGAATAWAAQHPGQIRLSLALAVSLMFPLIIAAVALIATTYRALEDAEKRRRIRWVVYTSIAGLSPQLLRWRARHRRTRGWR